MPAAPATNRIEEAIDRSMVYGLFAHVFAYPDEERIEELRQAAEDVLQTSAAVPLMRLAALARESTRESLEPVYISVTTLSSSPDCPAFETAYFGNDAIQQTQRMADVAGFYRAFGVDATEGGFRPDELPVELEFMGYLCNKEAYAIEHLGAPRAGQARKAQRTFLTEHLGRWGGVFGRKLAKTAPQGHFYFVAGQTLSLWLEAECARLGANPEEVSGDASQVFAVPSSHGPEFAGNTSFVPMEELAVR